MRRFFYACRKKIYILDSMKPMPVYIFFEILSFLASLTLFFQKSTPRYMKSFPFFLLVTVAVELIGWRIAKNRQILLWMYNIFAVVTFDFYLFILWNFINNRIVKRVILHSIWIYAILALTNLFFIQINAFNSITFAFGCLIIVAFCIYYFFELFQLSRSINLLKEQAFWISSGLLFFHCCSFMLFSLTNLLNKSSAAILDNLQYLLDLILIMFYLLFTIAFLCRLDLKKKAKTV
jgi:hypothetical protein